MQDEPKIHQANLDIQCPAQQTMFVKCSPYGITFTDYVTERQTAAKYANRVIPISSNPHVDRCICKAFLFPVEISIKMPFYIDL